MYTVGSAAVPSVPHISPSPTQHDRELRCDDCGTRVFTSRAPELAEADFRCPRCLGHVELIPDAEEV